MNPNTGCKMAQWNKLIDSHHTLEIESLPKNSHHRSLKRVFHDREAWKVTSYQMTFYDARLEIMKLKAGGGIQQVTSQKIAWCTICRKTSHRRDCLNHHRGSCRKTWMMREMLICLTLLVSLTWKTSFTVNHSFLTGLPHFVQRIMAVCLSCPKSQILKGPFHIHLKAV